MIRKKREELFTLVEGFFHNYLHHTCGARHHILGSTREALRLFFFTPQTPEAVELCPSYQPRRPPALQDDMPWVFV